ncbi:helix-turn-helix transcriptional regulator [Mycobacterium sp. Aquia_213]|uniref:helix-turn-helix transcriptional regulator n=1 Tax=Mycobacterium sp. Aquia_213 TaxID=2991728 RepID=UPI00226E73B0|nr:LuxR family transcriptional regulator [Mycobacterium sp. Aquia_213]WAC94144.1 LuxR C-terminal-related transcriptional regulator [Mycobacterium sp. Aquia_213]
MLHGRERECAQVDELLAAARERRSQALVVRGEAGVGKSALLDYAARRASDLQVLRTSGIQTESQLPFAAVHNLLLPVLDRCDAIPERQQAALRSAFGLGAAIADDRFLISLAVLSILAETAETAPVLCLVDDAQWLDGPSADALTFAARRIKAEGIVVLCAARDDATTPFAAQGLPELRLSGLDPAAAGTLLAEQTGVAVAAPVRDRLAADTLGNPLALAELARSLSAEQIAGRARLPDQLPVSTDLERLYLDRAAELPADTQTMLLVVAAHDNGQLGGILRAARELDVDEGALDAAETSGLLRVDSAIVSFVHPLARSAIYRGATSRRRQEVERVLASVLDDATDADRKAWHLANAAAGPDEDVASAVHGAAERARTRGGHATAATAFERAAALTAAPDLRATRLTDAADSAWLAGQPDRARALLDQAGSLASAATLRARVEHLRGTIEGNCGAPSAAYAILVGGAEPVMSEDPVRAIQMLSEAGQLAWAGGDLARMTEVSGRLASLAEERPDKNAANFVGAHVLTGLSGLLRGDTSTTAARLRDAADLAGATKEPRALMGAAAGAMFLGDDARAIDLFCTAVALTRGAAGAANLPLLLAPLAMVETLTSRYPAAIADATEGLRLAEETSQRNPAAHLRGILAIVAAVQGREQECRDHAGAALTQAIGQRLGPHAAIASWALAVLDLGAGRPAEAFERLEASASAAPGEGNQMVMLLATADLVEAATRTQHRAAAAAATDRLQAWATDTGAPWARPLVARCHGLLATDDDQDRHFAEALRLHAPAGRPFDMARTQLLYGESLRRRRRRADARKFLRAAHETFERLGAAPWAEHTGAELLATGETARKRDVSTADQLTPQELQIARFVSEGETNRSIATLMFLSPRTVDYHVSKIFTKLGLSSRAELMRMFLRDDTFARRDPG